MDAAAAIAWARPASTSLTVRQFQRALTLVAAVVAVGCVGYVVETFLVGPRRRLVENPVDVMMRATGLAHFLVGWLFLFTSKKLRSLHAVGRLSAATAAGVVLCLAFARFEALEQPLAILLFYGLFLVHEVGDEAELFQAYGDAPAASRRELLTSLSRAVSLVLIAVLGLGHLFHAAATNKTDLLERLPLPWVTAGAAVLLLACAWTCAWAVRLGRQLHGDLRTVVALYQPLLMVYAGLLALLVLGSFLGSVGLNLVILVHVAAWFVSAHYHLGRRPTPQTGNPWTWLRGTPTGFLVLHLGLALAVLALMGLRIYAWERSGLVSDLVAKSSFYYWSIMHICMSFGRLR